LPDVPGFAVAVAVVLLASVVFLAGIAIALVALRRRAATRRAERLAREARRLGRRELATRYPLVLAHGFMGFDDIQLLGRRHSYFRGVVAGLDARLLEAPPIYCPRVPPLASVAVRAERLAAFLRGLDAPRVNLVAHSMGGLDARYALAFAERLGIGARVASLTTIGTPHRGTPLADLGNRVVKVLGPFLTGAGIDISGLACLTTARMAEFNREVVDVRGVSYGSVVATASRDSVHPLLRAGHRYLLRCAGPNDGMVPAASQEWGEVLRRVDADHLAQIGWSFASPLAWPRRGDAVSAVEMFADLVRELRGRGL
jgi:triacylglycerol lipase